MVFWNFIKLMINFIINYRQITIILFNFCKFLKIKIRLYLLLVIIIILKNKLTYFKWNMNIADRIIIIWDLQSRNVV